MRLRYFINLALCQAVVFVMGLCVVPSPVSSQSTNSATITSNCMPSFPYKDGWLGGDAAYSIALAPGKSLWLFGDSLVGNGGLTRSESRFVRNSIALSTCDEQQHWQINYYWGNQKKRAARSFFETNTKKYWYWPLDGFLYRNRLYLAIAKLEDNPKEKVFAFKTAGVVLAKISNPAAPPNQWRIKYSKLTEGSDFYPGSTIVIQGTHAYFFALDEVKKAMILSRIPLNKLDEPSAHLEYLARDKSWKHGLNGVDAHILIETGHSEMSVRYHPEIKQWLAVMGGDFMSNKIMVRTAPELVGPWSQVQAAYEFPEMNPKTEGHDTDTFCYAVKEHIEFASSSKLLVTYACNSFKFEKMISNMSIYHPQAVLIEFPLRTK